MIGQDKDSVVILERVDLGCNCCVSATKNENRSQNSVSKIPFLFSKIHHTIDTY